ncbi:permease [Sulfuricurvum sp. RIFCSPLOWO2_12_FULL_43_24]|uniref:permease n=1 Tax=Sulfuricurvum sp. RIFCSPLOWO2_12_FULL_43_24 TaxID=1802247 RepID=UPI0008CD3D57|nr:permease [Sulfuricurvum sp. RIFCSPLOWO2_12_FULL_43_24]OHD89052.1 MAG: permease [Sulfuricurvum sp. RIFCSPLOWO2_12_FULL_43_24]
MWQESVNILVYEWLKMPQGEKISDALNFFIYDTIKILFLLIVIIFIVTLLRSYFSTEKVREYLSKKHEYTGNVLAALFGIITPFCSCSAIPLFLGFLQARIPLGVTFSFLISAPLNNEIAIAMLFGLFGWKVTALYIGFGLLVAIVGGIIIGRLDLEKEILIEVKPIEGEIKAEAQVIPFKIRLIEAKAYTLDIFRKIWLYVLIGVSVGAFIHGYVPTEIITSIAGADNLFAVPLATLLGVPMYSNAAGVMPLIEVLTSKGMLLGTALSFMMAITALSLPEAMILKRVMSLKLIGIFFGTVTLGIMGVGYLFNAIL